MDEHKPDKTMNDTQPEDVFIPGPPEDLGELFHQDPPVADYTDMEPFNTFVEHIFERMSEIDDAGGSAIAKATNRETVKLPDVSNWDTKTWYRKLCEINEDAPLSEAEFRELGSFDQLELLGDIIQEINLEHVSEDELKVVETITIELESALKELKEHFDITGSLLERSAETDALTMFYKGVTASLLGGKVGLYSARLAVEEIDDTWWENREPTIEQVEKVMVETPTFEKHVEQQLDNADNGNYGG